VERVESDERRDVAAAAGMACRDGTGLLVVGHGTADPVGAEETRALTRGVAALLPGAAVDLGFLEVIRPSIADTMRSMADRGCGRVVAAPLLLLTAGHARRDVPDALHDAALALGMEVVQASAIGCHPAVVELSRRRRAEALAGRDSVPPHEAVLVMLGRGSSADDGIAQFREVVAATLVGDADVDTRFEIGFAAAARPSLDEALEAAARRHPRRVVVQPHLLFRGHVENQVTEAVSRVRLAYPRIEWIQVHRLGPDALVARAVVARAIEAMEDACSEGGVFFAGKNVSPDGD
jgi:sirohydrochlorin cobaltochelatase